MLRRRTGRSPKTLLSMKLRRRFLDSQGKMGGRTTDQRADNEEHQIRFRGTNTVLRHDWLQCGVTPMDGCMTSAVGGRCTAGQAHHIVRWGPLSSSTDHADSQPAPGIAIPIFLSTVPNTPEACQLFAGGRASATSLANGPTAIRNPEGCHQQDCLPCTTSKTSEPSGSHEGHVTALRFFQSFHLRKLCRVP